MALHGRESEQAATRTCLVPPVLVIAAEAGAGKTALLDVAVPGPAWRFGPDMALHVRFDRPSAHRLWAQFELADGAIVTAPFVVHT